MLEAQCLLQDLGATAPTGGPLSEQGAVFWIELAEEAETAARDRLPRLGYTVAVDAVVPVPGGAAPRGERGVLVRWRGAPHRIERIYEEDAGAARESAPDRRVFLLPDAAGDVRPVRGYRGDGGEMSRRALPVCDARLLVNLVAPAFQSGEGPGRLLDPFAGAGGIVREALAGGGAGGPLPLVASVDLDAVLRFGLAALGARHSVADAARLPFRDAMFDAVATEPPYHAEALPAVVGALGEIARVLRPGGRVAMLCAAPQAEPLRLAAAACTLTRFLDAAIDRKGLGVVALAWRKQAPQ